MIDVLKYIGVFLAGLALGLFFFGGLWFTVRRALVASIPALWFGLSFVVRFGVTILGFYLVGDGSIQNMLVCALGFVVARFAVARITRFFPKITENQAT